MTVGDKFFVVVDFVHPKVKEYVRDRLKHEQPIRTATTRTISIGIGIKNKNQNKHKNKSNNHKRSTENATDATTTTTASPTSTSALAPQRKHVEHHLVSSCSNRNTKHSSNNSNHKETTPTASGPATTTADATCRTKTPAPLKQWLTLQMQHCGRGVCRLERCDQWVHPSFWWKLFILDHLLKQRSRC